MFLNRLGLLNDIMMEDLEDRKHLKRDSIHKIVGNMKRGIRASLREQEGTTEDRSSRRRTGDRNVKRNDGDRYPRKQSDRPSQNHTDGGGRGYRGERTHGPTNRRKFFGNDRNERQHRRNDSYDYGDNRAQHNDEQERQQRQRTDREQHVNWIYQQREHDRSGHQDKQTGGVNVAAERRGDSGSKSGLLPATGKFPQKSPNENGLIDVLRNFVSAINPLLCT